MSTTNGPPPPTRKYSGGQIAMIVIGSILLLPGVCSLLFMLGMAAEMKNATRDPIVQALLVLWGICFVVSAIGVILIVVARKRAQAAR